MPQSEKIQPSAVSPILNAPSNLPLANQARKSNYSGNPTATVASESLRTEKTKHPLPDSEDPLVARYSKLPKLLAPKRGAGWDMEDQLEDQKCLNERSLLELRQAKSEIGILEGRIKQLNS